MDEYYDPDATTGRGSTAHRNVLDSIRKTSNQIPSQEIQRLPNRTRGADRGVSLYFVSELNGADGGINSVLELP